MQKNTLIMMLATLTSLYAIPASAEDNPISGNIGVFSQYASRGLSYTSGKPAVQGDVVASYDGLSASLWFSNAYPSPAPQFAGRDVVEFDWVLDYSGTTKAFGYSIGAAYYTYLYDSASNYPEVYASLSYEATFSPSLKGYLTVLDSHSKATLTGDIWVDFSLSTDVAGLTFSAGASYAHWASDTVNRINTDIYKDGLSLANIGVSKDIEVGDITLTASLTGSIPIIADSADGNKYIYGTIAENEVVFGLSLAY